MVILAQTSNFQNCIKKTNKIPEYARDFKNEYLFIRGINKEIESFVEKYLTDTTELFVSSYNDRIKSFIKKKFKCGRPSKESSLKVATTRAELHKIQHKSIQVVAEGIGLENYLIRNVAALHKLSMHCLSKKN